MNHRHTGLRRTGWFAAPHPFAAGRVGPGAMLAAKGEEPVEQQGFGFPLHKPTTELAQHGGVEARIG